MTDTINRPLPARALILSTLASGMLLSGFGGCSKNDHAKEAVSDAGFEFSKVSVGDPTLSDSIANAAYTEAGNLVSEYTDSDSPFGEAASVSMALSKLGLATLAGGQVSEVETVAFQQSRVIRGHLSEWIAMNAVAKASMNFDTADDKQALQELITLRTADVAQYTQLFNKIQEEIQNYQSQIDELDAKSVAERNASAGFELQMTSVSATQAAKLAERVREHSLRADNFELESVRLQGRLGQLLPGAHEIELQVKKAKDQIDLLNLSIDELDQRVRDAKEDSAQARANAQQAQTALTELVNQLEDYRANTVSPATQKVISLLRQSLTAARNAKDTAKSSGAIAKASANEHLARTLSRQARGHADMVSLYLSIIDSGVTGDWNSKLEEHTTRRDELIEESNQAFQSAASALRSARARGETGQSMEAAAVRLDRLGGVEPEPEYSEDYESDEPDYDNGEFDEEMQGDMNDEFDSELDPDAEFIEDDG